MNTTSVLPADAGAIIAEIRKSFKDPRLSQADLARYAEIDQSRVSRIENGEQTTIAEITKLLLALTAQGSDVSLKYMHYMQMEWRKLPRPAFSNPQFESLVLADKKLQEIDQFLTIDRPWPLRRQLEQQRAAMSEISAYLDNMSHHIAFLGNIGVGKSTAISFLFGLLTPPGESGKLARSVLETGGGRTTLCEVHIRKGPRHGIAIQPLSESEMRALVSDFCASVWQRRNGSASDSDPEDVVSIGEEVGRAIRNMSDLGVKRERKQDGKRLTKDTARELASSCEAEDEFRSRVMERMQLHRRARRELWHDQSSEGVPLKWLADRFRDVNNGRLPDVPFPRTIDLLIPDFGAETAPLEIAVVDTKGIEDIAVRPDLDARLKDSRTVTILCSPFNEAPGPTVKALLEHLIRTFGEAIESGKIAILALPRPGEAVTVKDDSGVSASDDVEGYELKSEQIDRVLGGGGLGGAPVYFFNATSDDPTSVRKSLLGLVDKVRNEHASRIQELGDTIDDLIRNHETHSVTAAIGVVATRLGQFLKARRQLKQRERHAYLEVLTQLQNLRYASTLWASTRRSGDYPGFDVVHYIGVGASQDALRRSSDWFKQLKSQLDTLKQDSGLSLAHRAIDQIAMSVESWRKNFARAVGGDASELYREVLTDDSVLWSKCAREWGSGRGFRDRVKNHLTEWFEEKENLRDALDARTQKLWEEQVIQPLQNLCDDPGTA